MEQRKSCAITGVVPGDSGALGAVPGSDSLEDGKSSSVISDSIMGDSVEEEIDSVGDSSESGGLVGGESISAEMDSEMDSELGSDMDSEMGSDMGRSEGVSDVPD